MTPTLNTEALLAELGARVGQEVILRRTVNRFGQALWLIKPKGVGLLSTPFWRAVQSAPGFGLYESPEKALVGFAASLATLARAAAAEASQGLENGLRGLLANGPVPVAVVMSTYAGQGLSRDRVDRAGRRIGVVRRKVGMHAGWTWNLPLEVSGQDFDADCEGRTLNSATAKP